ncbi:RNA 2',3'-cyclic phosphodiesterase [Paenibacillus thermotolerans]|uniref:RNA 2',3'-cyclic phosphodiesterase n=1 Tax=Paenibacillus thermotolerans TaxID=3027807 RepID=UPI002367EC1E|nr:MULTISPECIES: RNA 2',3'-cyclic phosphodiesterase [unclassified Paenibacillus]
MSHDQRAEGTVRLFFAAALAPSVKEALQSACANWKETLPFARWTHPADLHVTVKFIGDVNPELGEELVPLVRNAVRGEAPFELSLGPLGVFGRPNAPSILWCGVGGRSGLDALEKLHARTEEAAARLGVAKEMRPFRPHITVARNYRGGDTPFSKPMLYSAAPVPASQWTVRELTLYRTRFGMRPAYEALAQLPLEGAASEEH